MARKINREALSALCPKTVKQLRDDKHALETHPRRNFHALPYYCNSEPFIHINMASRLIREVLFSIEKTCYYLNQFHFSLFYQPFTQDRRYVNPWLLSTAILAFYIFGFYNSPNIISIMCTTNFTFRFLILSISEFSFPFS